MLKSEVNADNLNFALVDGKLGQNHLMVSGLRGVTKVHMNQHVSHPQESIFR